MSKSLAALLSEASYTQGMATPLLSVVVIARNEEKHIAQCLDAVIRAAGRYPDAQMVLVDSNSTDRTVQIASRYPISVYRYCGPPYSAAAGRAVGFARTCSRYVLFVDGDCCIDSAWLDSALKRLDAEPSGGLIYGLRQEVFEEGTQHVAGSAPAAAEYGLGGNALYRSDALRRAGGFNPYLTAGEEAELLGRVLALGYRDLSTDTVMFTHYTLAKTSFVGFLSRLRKGLSRGLGQTLRLSIEQGLFFYHARRLNRYLLALSYLWAGIATTILAFLSRNGRPFMIWALGGAALFLLLCYRRRSVRSAAFIVADWIAVAVHLPGDFLRTPHHPEEFCPPIECLQKAP
jgi:glycosyltransferase involved in cell wall biosynthesis